MGYGYAVIAVVSCTLAMAALGGLILWLSRRGKQNEVNSQVAQLRSDLDTCYTELSLASVSLSDLRAKNYELAGSLSIFDSREKELEARLAAKEANLQECARKRSDLEAETKTRKTTLMTLQSESDGLQVQISLLNSGLRFKDGLLASRDSEIEKLRGELAASGFTIQRLEGD